MQACLFLARDCNACKFESCTYALGLVFQNLPEIYLYVLQL